MKLSIVEIVIQCAAILVIAPALAASLSPSVDAISLIFCWLGVVVLFEIGFFLLRWVGRRRP